MFFEVRFDRLQVLHTHVRRVADHHIKAAARHDFREGRRPIERSRRIVVATVGRTDQAVAHAQIGFQAVQRFATLCRF